nr:hypothetical protein [Xanthomonas axonopodis]
MEQHLWTEAVRFLPYCGELYPEGICGQRVLLLGESHYRKEGISDSLSVTRPFTRETFGGMVTPVRDPRDGPFFRGLDLLLTGRLNFEPEEAANAWKRIAFANLSQVFAGSEANHRPRDSDLRYGGDVLVHQILPVVKPTVVLVLGRTTWLNFRHGRHRPDLRPFVAGQVNRGAGRRRYIEGREIWSLGYKGGAALMTWVYHPSWNVDSWTDRHAALRYLVKMATLEARPSRRQF